MRGRSSNTSTVPSTSPRMPATPDVGCICADATWSSVVLPAPLGPRTTQRSSSSTVQSTPSSRVACPRAHRHVGELEDGGHGRHPIRARDRRPRRILAGRDRPPCPAACPAGLVGHVLAARPRGRPTTCSTPCAARTRRTLRPARRGGTELLVTGLGRLRAAGADGLGVALPVEGDPLGLGGPPAFNAAALEAGEAVVARGQPALGLVPRRGRGRVRPWWRGRRSAGSCRTSARPTARCARAARHRDRSRRAGRRPVAAGGRRRADGPAAPAPRSTRRRACPPLCVELAARGLQALGDRRARARRRRRRGVGVRDRGAPGGPAPARPRRPPGAGRGVLARGVAADSALVDAEPVAGGVGEVEPAPAGVVVGPLDDARRRRPSTAATARRRRRTRAAPGCRPGRPRPTVEPADLAVTAGCPDAGVVGAVVVELPAEEPAVEGFRAATPSGRRRRARRTGSCGDVLVMAWTLDAGHRQRR